jgi:hypothetical protein
MASTPLGDIPGARFHEALAATAGAVASGGPNARLGQFGPFAHNIRIRNAWWVPTGADQVATNTASYRRQSLYDGGVSGTVTATANRMASLNMNFSQASLGAMTWASIDRTLSAGNILYWSQETVGGTETLGTVMAAGQLAFAYEVM